MTNTLTRHDASPLPFATLDPGSIVRAIESTAFRVEGEPFALNSYENRVYSFRDEEGQRWVAKFYRPGRWSDEAILEEHQLLMHLYEQGVPVGNVWRNAEGNSLFHIEGQRLAIFPYIVGRSPMLEDPDELFALGQLIGQMHSAAAAMALPHRPEFDPLRLCRESREIVLNSGRFSSQNHADYDVVSKKIIKAIESLALPQVNPIVTHNDCHPGNVLGHEQSYTLVDFDDCGYAPAIQDLWMFLSDPNEQGWRQQLSELIEGYEEFHEFDRREIQWIEVLRTVRLMRHSAWILDRWPDPAFPQAFPWVNDEGYWQSHIRELEAQRLVMSPQRWMA